MSKKTVCNNCGAKVNGDAKFCPKCGTKFISSEELEKPARLFAKIAGIILLLETGLGALAMLALMLTGELMVILITMITLAFAVFLIIYSLDLIKFKKVVSRANQLTWFFAIVFVLNLFSSNMLSLALTLAHVVAFFILYSKVKKLESK